METAMFAHILLPIDSSEQCRKATDGTLELACTTGYRLTAYARTEELPNMAYSAGVGECPHAYYTEMMQGYTKEYAGRIAECAREKGVRFGSDVSQFAEPYPSILDTVKRHACDVIFMASHGHHNLMGRLLIGNETHRMLTYAGMLVVIYHWSCFALHCGQLRRRRIFVMFRRELGHMPGFTTGDLPAPLGHEHLHDLGVGLHTQSRFVRCDAAQWFG